MFRTFVALTLCLSLAACGSSRLNPLNWFGGDREERVRVTETVAAVPADPRPLVAEVVALAVEQTTSGALVRATGLVPTQGYFDAALVEVQRGDGALVYEFRAAPPIGGGLPGPARSREVLVAVALDQSDLRGLRTITVIGQTNRRSVDRR